MSGMSAEELKVYLEKQIAEMQSPTNRWFAGEKLGHDPSPSEASLHFVQSGAATTFRQDYETRFRNQNQTPNSSLV